MAGVPLRVVLIAGVIGVSFFNLLHTFSVILTSGVGKNGTTVAVREGVGEGEGEGEGDGEGDGEGEGEGSSSE